jgi:hypothetical protein
MPYRITGIDVHKKMLAVIVSDVEDEGGITSSGGGLVTYVSGRSENQKSVCLQDREVIPGEIRKPQPSALCRGADS